MQEEFVVGVPKKKHLQPYDKFLKNFQYRNALDAALKVVFLTLFRMRLCVIVDFFLLSASRDW